MCVVPDFIEGTASAISPAGPVSVYVWVCVQGSDITGCLCSYGDAGSRTGCVREVGDDRQMGARTQTNIKHSLTCGNDRRRASLCVRGSDDIAMT